MEALQQLQEKLGIKFTDSKLLEQAFIHRSYLNEHSFPLGHNERLEFLGDAVLELIVSNYLYKTFPEKPEGELTAIRAALVRRETLKEVADELEFHKYLKLSRGEAKSVINQAAILSNTVESVIGAIYLDQGITWAEKFIQQYLIPKTHPIVAAQSYVDAKSHLQELAQEKDSFTPTYQVVNESGPDHNKIFEVAVLIGKKEWGRGTGNSKQTAEMAAAADALTKYSA
ncbi:MAG: ribonuclease III [Patescibacteria group bacterium]|jgi:ribonuclease-3